MDLSKIEKLIDFVGRSNVAELTVTEKGTTVRIFRDRSSDLPLSSDVTAAPSAADVPATSVAAGRQRSGTTVSAPIFGVLHIAPAPDDPPFVSVGDAVDEGQTLFIIEAMKVFNKIAAPRAGKITRLADVNGAEVEVGDVLAEIA
ncbi:acetyl-CoA carboxylase biotin carboxyl carrier protein subunit [Rhizobiales bacterium RZME27]|jgi:acetyl-CoA carboxylase biotin carboxyl carrier protein|uniref:Biotin carboxyl carrier protein of acetyl-CoA carboxylase n=1 Tax=Endobacterium cereale TaxID=2663029 RepID=A0A6A8ACE3_9HYPH|nr:acetyl-CoA carboxylase biotin carboxyl carrier protein subunit [Endobacterium cereale]MEB2847787.1 acetyl-CoA carboxylase biotin carboxyl carrier protein subunit [Endobacterium cereale]MQY46876.1 acetyl-CoA carboxylase biotin carboxyl carrier protein subunit [Endobacterium cereale]